MNLLLHQARFDLLGVKRNTRARVMAFAFPILLLVILAGLASGTTTVNGDTIALKRFYVPGIIAMALMGSAFATVVATVVGRRENGVFKRRRATPVPAWVIVGGQALATVALCAATTTALLVVAAVAYDITIGPTALLGVALAVLAGAIVFSALAYAVSTLVPNVDAAQPTVQLTMFPIYFISGIWFTTDDMPKALQTIGELLPVQPVADLLHRAFLDPGVIARDVAVLAVWTAVALIVAAKRFSWLPKS
ncbi:MAG: type transport system permease protein [Solirubrobacteraceae bacterium]|jgi:ABC-2 type transport system permease protein|nr:type transport system permease protein [Solirubrobacteraceae bacterium]